MKKKLLFISLLAVVALALAACTPQAPAATATPEPQTEAPAEPTEAPAEPTEAPEEPTEALEEPTQAPEEPAQTSTEGGEESLELSLEELAKFNGKDGARAYVAVDGIIYDVTDSALWKDGGHNGFEAGQDLTEEIKDKSPHGLKVLERMPKVGTLKAE